MRARTEYVLHNLIEGAELGDRDPVEEDGGVVVLHVVEVDGLRQVPAVRGNGVAMWSLVLRVIIWR